MAGKPNRDISSGLPRLIDVTSADFDCVASNPLNGQHRTAQYGSRAITQLPGGTMVVENFDGTTVTYPAVTAMITHPIQVAKVLTTSGQKQHIVLF